MVNNISYNVFRPFLESLIPFYRVKIKLDRLLRIHIPSISPDRLCSQPIKILILISRFKFSLTFCILWGKNRVLEHIALYFCLLIKRWTLSKLCELIQENFPLFLLHVIRLQDPHIVNYLIAFFLLDCGLKHKSIAWFVFQLRQNLHDLIRTWTNVNWGFLLYILQELLD